LDTECGNGERKRPAFVSEAQAKVQIEGLLWSLLFKRAFDLLRPQTQYELAQAIGQAASEALRDRPGLRRQISEAVDRMKLGTSGRLPLVHQDGAALEE